MICSSMLKHQLSI